MSEYIVTPLGSYERLAKYIEEEEKKAKIQEEKERIEKEKATLREAKIKIDTESISVMESIVSELQVVLKSEIMKAREAKTPDEKTIAIENVVECKTLLSTAENGVKKMLKSLSTEEECDARTSTIGYRAEEIDEKQARESPLDYLYSIACAIKSSGMTYKIKDLYEMKSVEDAINLMERTTGSCGRDALEQTLKIYEPLTRKGILLFGAISDDRLDAPLIDTISPEYFAALNELATIPGASPLVVKRLSDTVLAGLQPIQKVRTLITLIRSLPVPNESKRRQRQTPSAGKQ